MDIRQLKYFVQIVESGSLSKASRQLFIAQPALSQQMARMEEEVGNPLLVRSVRGVTPTENGRALYHQAKFILRQIDDAMSIARREHYSVSGRVTIGLAPTTVCAIGHALIKRLRQRYPGIVLNVVEGLSGHLEHMARMGQLDLAILFNPNAASELEVEPIFEEELFLILPDDSELLPAQQTEIALADVTSLPLILPSVGHGLRRRIAIELERLSLSIDAVAEIDSLPLLMRCVRDHVGGTIKPYAAVHALDDAPERWRCVTISGVKLTRPNFLYSLPAHKVSPGTAAVRAELQELVRELSASDGWRGVSLDPSIGTREGERGWADDTIEADA